MNEPTLPGTRVGLYFLGGFLQNVRCDAPFLYILRDHSKSNPAHPWKSQQVWRGAQESGRAVFGQHGSCFCLRPTSQREPCLARCFPAAAKGGAVGWHLGRVSPWAAFKMTEREEKQTAEGLTMKFQADQRNQGTKLPFRNSGTAAPHSRY